MMALFEPREPLVLGFDTERAPLEALLKRWSLHEDTRIRADEIIKRSHQVSFSAIWGHDRDNPIHHNIYEHGRTQMLLAQKELIELADILVTYNGKAFDMKHVNTELDYAGLKLSRFPKHQDLLLFERKYFKHDSNKLDYVAQRRRIGKKLDSGLSHNDLLGRCEAGDKDALKMLRDYNNQDSLLNLDLRDSHLPRWEEELGRL